MLKQRIIKSISILLGAALALSLTVFPSFAAVIFGDANGDGAVMADDARIILRASVGLDTPTADKRTMDVDGNGEIGAEDARLVLRYSVGLETVFPAEPPILQLEVGASSALLYDVQAEKTVFAKNTARTTAPASITKLLTALTALEYCSEDTVMTVGNEIDLIGEDSSVCYVRKGWRASLKTILSGMLTASGNDAAYTVAVNVMRKGHTYLSDRDAVNAFVEKMNLKAKELGMTHSRFVNPDGYDAAGQYTTAEDILLLAIAASNNPTVMRICGTYRLTAYLANGTDLTFYNTNRLLNPKDKYYSPLVNGLKTGSTPDAGLCITVTFSKNGRQYIAVVLGAATDDARYTSVHTMMNAVG
ncbi:MAG: hypothetical protein IJJ85_09180 [Clostridia bacterium]|nr:hypothetical protein [Clostridia bacterium]